MAQTYRWIAQDEKLPRRYELLPNFGLKVTQDFELPMSTYILKLKAGTTYEPGQRYFRELAFLWRQGFTALTPARLVRDLDPIPEADIAAQLRRLVLHPPQSVLPSPETAPTSTPDDGPQMLLAKHHAHNSLSPRVMKIFQKNLIDTVLRYVRDFGKDDIPSGGRLHKDFPGQLSDSQWRTRRNRTIEDWRCTTWEDVFLLIVHTSEKLKCTASEDIFLHIINTKT